MSDLVERLEPCPFCAGIADDTHAGVAPELHEDSHTNIYVWCPNCGAKGLVVVGAHGGTRQEAIAAWHRRAESPDLTRLRSEVERLTEQARRNDLQARLAIRGKSLAETKLTTLTARTREVLDEMLMHSCINDIPDEDKFPEDLAAERAARSLFNELKEKDNG